MDPFGVRLSFSEVGVSHRHGFGRVTKESNVYVVYCLYKINIPSGIV